MLYKNCVCVNINIILTLYTLKTPGLFLQPIFWVICVGLKLWVIFSESNHFLGYRANILTHIMGCLGFWVIFQRVTHVLGWLSLSLSPARSCSGIFSQQSFEITVASRSIRFGLCFIGATSSIFKVREYFQC